MRRSLLVLTVAVLALAAATSMALAGGKRAARTSFTVGSFTHSGHVKKEIAPSRFKVESPDSYILFYRLHWRGWGSGRAIAHGKAKTCEYVPDCDSHTTKLVADQRHRCSDGQWSYWRLTASVVPDWGDGPVALPVRRFPCKKRIPSRHCDAYHLINDPNAVIISKGPGCDRARWIIREFMRKAQTQGSPTTVGGFECTALPDKIVCRHHQERVTYYGAP